MLAVAATMVTACGPAATAGCDKAFKTMEAEVDQMSAASATAYSDEQWNAIELGPLNACKGFGDWLDGAKEHPGALGVTSADAVDIELLVIRCYPTDAAATRVCKNMQDSGLL